ncbi:hypothetical protein BKA65DRAFT_527621 [Rhexocercosporidium sp. MPI-PUGE-AT-0058]|nr:hypothetical protein BKA65DRAFT_527621 [Rhexocercosporidium sp. MPI-PUGE-AT-0058]
MTTTYSIKSDILDKDKNSSVTYSLTRPRLKLLSHSTSVQRSADGYDVCIPVYISPPSNVRSVLVRIPLPYKVGEAKSPGNVDEKLRCEVASYLWIQENCPDVSIPYLFGFGFSNGQTIQQTSLFIRSMWCGCTGEMLSNTWETFRHDKTRRSNLFHGLARIILSLNKSPLAAIGSLTLNDQGFTTLANRPLTLQIQSLENEGIPTTIGRGSTYSAVEPYLLDLLSCHDNRISFQPNAIHDQDDGEQQMAALTMMRAVLHHFCPRDSRYRPFVFIFTDLHQSNIFVDNNWHITSLIDLEWSCSLPIQLQCPPYWLSGRAIDQMELGEHLEAFHQLVLEYLEAFEQEERDIAGKGLHQAPILRKCWESGSFWYFHAINSPKGLCRVFTEHIQRLFFVAPYWRVGAAEEIKRKIEEEERYKHQLKEVFSAEVTLLNA